MSRAPDQLSVDAPESAAPRLAYLVYRVERRLRSRLDEAVSAHGVSTAEYIALSVLRERDGLSGAQLARWVFVTPQAMNLVLTALEQRGLVRRRPDARHRRVLRTSLTRRGLETLALCERSMDRIERDMVRGVDEASLGAVRASLASFAHSLEATRPLPHPVPSAR